MSALTTVVLRRPRLLPWYSDIRAYCLGTQTSALNAVVHRRPHLNVGTQEHVETPKWTAGTGTRDLGSVGTPEYIKMEAGKINPLRFVQCGSYIHDIDVGKRESEKEKRDFHSNVSWSNVSC